MDGKNTEVNSFCKYLPKIEKKNSSKVLKKNPPKKSFINLDTIVPYIPDTIQKEKRKLSKNRVPTSQRIDDSYDIFTIDKIIRDRLEERYEEIGMMEQKLNTLIWIRDNTTDDIERIDAKKEIFKIKKKISAVKDRTEIKIYKEKTKDLLEQYRSTQISKRSFIFIERDPSEDEKEKEQLSKTFLIIARAYIQIDTHRNKNKKLICPVCQKSEFDTIDDNFYACKYCRRCIQLTDNGYSYKDIDRLNLSSRYTYTKRGHFKEAIDKFQGLQNTNIDKKVYDMIHYERKKHSITIEKLSHDHVVLFLSENSYSKHYEDVTLIHCAITGCKAPDISQYENNLLRMFDQQEEVYEKIKNPDRINSLNVNFKLMKLLQLLGYKCKIEDFGILKTREKIAEHDEIWMEICQHLGWRFIPTI